jgi:hypothetical protein
MLQGITVGHRTGKTCMLASALFEDVEDFIDVRGTVARCITSLGTMSAREWLEVYERAVDELASFEVEAAFAPRVPATGMIRTHADAARHLARSQTSLAKALLRLGQPSWSAPRTVAQDCPAQADATVGSLAA